MVQGGKQAQESLLLFWGAKDFSRHLQTSFKENKLVLVRVAAFGFLSFGDVPLCSEAAGQLKFKKIQNFSEQIDQSTSLLCRLPAREHEVPEKPPLVCDLAQWNTDGNVNFFIS